MISNLLKTSFLNLQLTMSICLPVYMFIICAIWHCKADDLPIGSFDSFNPDTYIATGFAFQNDSSNGKTPINITIILNETIPLITTLANQPYNNQKYANNGFKVDLSSFASKYFAFDKNCRLDIYALDRSDNTKEYLISNSPQFSQSMSYNLQLPRQLQGVDDQDYSGYLYGKNEMDQLQQRYKAELNDINVGVRRYNVFWAAVEPNPSSTNINTLPCNASDPNWMVVPSNEQDRIKRGYNKYHCYNKHSITEFDTFLTLDKSIGVVSGAIMYASPDWARYTNCTGFPWYAFNAF